LEGQEFRRFSKSFIFRGCAKLIPMKSINNTVTGLASSLLLNFGLSSLAEKLDPMKNNASLNSADAGFGCELCNFGCELCNFSPEAGQ
jgi:hypothetical protein